MPAIFTDGKLVYFDDHTWPGEQFFVIDKDWWKLLPSVVRWFTVFHESFHLTHLEHCDSTLPHSINPCEWEADCYACRIFVSAGYDLEELIIEVRKYIFRILYIPLSKHIGGSRMEWLFPEIWRRKKLDRNKRRLISRLLGKISRFI